MCFLDLVYELAHTYQMTRIYTILAAYSVVVLFSCSTAIYDLEPDEVGLIFYVEEINKPIRNPVLKLHFEGMENPIRLPLKTPASTAIIHSTENLHVTGLTASGGVSVSGTEMFEIKAPAGRITLVPYKIMITGKSQLVIESLSALDLEYAKSSFAKNEDLAGVDIYYSDLKIH